MSTYYQDFYDLAAAAQNAYYTPVEPATGAQELWVVVSYASLVWLALAGIVVLT